jgi:DNA-binding response OmpR family regulator
MMGNERTVLIVDDDLDFQFMVTTMLKMNGYEVRSLVEGKVSTVVNLARECDMILLDIRLPGVNGVDLGKELRSLDETTNIPIILLSGDSECDTLCLEAKANTFLKKPFSLSQLMEKIEGLCASDSDCP